jgi:HTH-type transcriptional regulator/antitoxin HigA
MKMNDNNWLVRRGGNDDCDVTSVGGAAFTVASESVSNEKRDWARFPVVEMVRRGWITCEESVGPEFFGLIRGWEQLSPLYRQTKVRSDKQIDPYSLAAWTARIVSRAQEEALSGRFEVDGTGPSLMTEIAQLSASSTGPQKAKDRLSHYGIALIIEPQLPRTHLDGAALLLDNNKAVIGMTVRYDRIDNFWFCLMHELAHLVLHFGNDQTSYFFDDLDQTEGVEPREKEADELAREALIPEIQWESSAAKVLPSKEAAELLANELGIHPAIVAGRMRYERSYTFLSELVGAGEIRHHFPGVEWS